MNSNDGPAFPVPFPPAGQRVTDELLNQWVKKMGGMTLRDNFAASALKGILADGAMQQFDRSNMNSTEIMSGLATLSYEAAKYMLAERERIENL